MTISSPQFYASGITTPKLVYDRQWEAAQAILDFAQATDTSTPHHPMGALSAFDRVNVEHSRALGARVHGNGIGMPFLADLVLNAHVNTQMATQHPRLSDGSLTGLRVFTPDLVPRLEDVFGSADFELSHFMEFFVTCFPHALESGLFYGAYHSGSATHLDANTQRDLLFRDFAYDARIDALKFSLGAAELIPSVTLMLALSWYFRAEEPDGFFPEDYRNIPNVCFVAATRKAQSQASGLLAQGFVPFRLPATDGMVENAGSHDAYSPLDTMLLDLANATRVTTSLPKVDVRMAGMFLVALDEALQTHPQLAYKVLKLQNTIRNLRFEPGVSSVDSLGGKIAQLMATLVRGEAEIAPRLTTQIFDELRTQIGTLSRHHPEKVSAMERLLSSLQTAITRRSLDRAAIQASLRGAA